MGLAEETDFGFNLRDINVDFLDDTDFDIKPFSCEKSKECSFIETYSKMGNSNLRDSEIILNYCSGEKGYEFCGVIGGQQ